MESVKSRVINLWEAFPLVEWSKLKLAFEIEFKKHYLEGDCSAYERIEVSHADALGVPEVRRAYDELTDKNFIFDKLDEFENQFEHKFQWGLVEVRLDVKARRVARAKVFSDSLVPDFIARLESRLNQGDIEYSQKGFRSLEAMDLQGLPEAARGYAGEVARWLSEAMD